MMRYLSYLIFTSLLALISCENESGNVPTLEGSVKGQIQIVDAYGYNLDDLSGVEIKISSGTYSTDTLTDENGNFFFNEVPFGKYELTCLKENYIQQTGNAAFGHVGGEVTTTVSEKMLGIPDFGYRIDSVEREYCYLKCYLQLYDASKTYAGSYYLVLMFFSDTPEVDSENYDAYDIDYGYMPGGIAWNWSFSVCYSDVLSSFTSDSIYCRVYPVPFCYYGSDEEYLTLPKGKPSNVFGFKR